MTNNNKDLKKEIKALNKQNVIIKEEIIQKNKIMKDNVKVIEELYKEKDLKNTNNNEKEKY